MLGLRELENGELPGFLEAADAFYVDDLMRHGGLTEEEAREKSRRDHASLFPDGRRQDGHHVLALELPDGARAGYLWFAERGTTVWLYMVEIAPELRGRGLGRLAMQEFEARARELGAEKVALNVFGGNDVARGLYRSLGYAQQAVQMGKRLA
jgi:ribosomal protein S18 acetylase RimI-like enzyme